MQSNSFNQGFQGQQNFYNQGQSNSYMQGMNQQMNQGFQQMNPQMNQGFQGMNQMNPQMNQGFQQMNQMNPQMNQGFQGMNQMGQMNQGMNQQMNPQMNQGFQGMNQMNQQINPQMSPAQSNSFGQGMNQQMNPQMNQGFQGMNQMGQMNQGMNQQMNPQMNPQMNQGMNPQMNQGMNQQMNPQMNQQAGPGSWVDFCYNKMYPSGNFNESWDDAVAKAGFLTSVLKKNVSNNLATVLTESLTVETRTAAGRLGMNRDDIFSIIAYTYDFGSENMDKNPYYTVNQVLLTRDEASLFNYIGYIIYLLKALRRLERSTAPVLYRGVKSGLKYTSADVGKTFTWDSFTSTTLEKEQAQNFTQRGSDPVLFTITGAYTGYNVNQFSMRPPENEVIIEPGFTFRVVSVSPDGKEVTVEGAPSAPVLQKAVDDLIAAEKSKFINITPQDIERFGSMATTTDMAMNAASPEYSWPQNFLTEILYPCTNMDQIAQAYGPRAWCPNIFTDFLRFANANPQYASILKKKLNMIVSLTTRRHFPTLSEIKENRINHPNTYAAHQYMPSNYGITDYIIPTPRVPCGISTKIPEPINGNFTKTFPQTMTYVIRADTMEIIKQANALFPQTKIACLNMGGQDKPGGGWDIGVISLEELLFMRTTLSASLEKYLYPMNNLECIYTENVTYIRNGMNEGYRFLAPNERFNFDVVTTCAFNLRKPIYDGTGRKVDNVILNFTPEIEQMTYQKIRSIFSACASKGAQVLILGALGCGAFSNPPDRIAMLFRQVIQEFSGVFNSVIFSILDFNPDMNRNAAYVFSEIIVGPGAGQLCAATQHASLNDVSNVFARY